MTVNNTVIFSHQGKLDDYVRECERDILWEIIKQHIPLNSSKILEAGAGSGKWLAFLSKFDCEMVGIELNQYSVKQFNESHPNIQYDVGDVRALPYDNKYFDAILSLGVLEHFVDGPELALSEMRRVLKDEGVAIVSVPSANLICKIEKVKDKIFFAILGSNVLRKILKRKPCKYNPIEQKKYYDELPNHLIQGLDIKFQFNPFEGIRFYEYRFQLQQILALLKQNGFYPTSVYLEYADQKMYQVCGSIVGRYFPGKGVTLNLLGKAMNNIIPKQLISHMIIITVKKH